MPFDEAAFTRTAAELVAQGDRVPAQRGAGDQRISVTPRSGEPYEVVVTYVEDEEIGVMRMNIKPDRADQEITPEDFRFITSHLRIPPRAAWLDDRKRA